MSAVEQAHLISWLKCRKKRLNQASFVLLCFVLFAFSGLCLVLLMSVFDLSSVLYFPASTDVNGSVQPNCADVPLKICSLTRAQVKAERHLLWWSLFKLQPLISRIQSDI